jgi:hypothetical protein
MYFKKKFIFDFKHEHNPIKTAFIYDFVPLHPKPFHMALIYGIEYISRN